MPVEKEQKYRAKVLFLGEHEVGKTSIIRRYCDDEFSPVSIHTLGIDFKTKNLEINGKIIELSIWDTAGQERFRSISQSYYNRAAGIMFVFDITNRKSFEDVIHWLELTEKCKVDEKVVKFLLGNKIDLAQDRRVHRDEGLRLAEQHAMEYYETSSKTNCNIDIAFWEMAAKIINKTQNPIPETDVITNVAEASNNKNKRRRC